MIQLERDIKLDIIAGEELKIKEIEVEELCV